MKLLHFKLILLISTIVWAVSLFGNSRSPAVLNNVEYNAPNEIELSQPSLKITGYDLKRYENVVYQKIILKKKESNVFNITILFAVTLIMFFIFGSIGLMISVITDIEQEIAEVYYFPQRKKEDVKKAG